jgi:hypothetical protein
MPLDLCSVTQADQPRKLSFLSTSLGIMADCDLGQSSDAAAPAGNPH